MSKLENLCDTNSNLRLLINNQPINWYQGLSKLLVTKYTDHSRTFISPDGSHQYYVVIHPVHVSAFMMLAIDLQTSRGVSRKLIVLLKYVTHTLRSFVFLCIFISKSHSFLKCVEQVNVVK